ncbi:hypothetical protein CERSUDRAFT_112303 [Gelatoporia subvermispora B]|uniref:Rad60/SUMO-like domain-containing protein n=1 Tax=Ceriporiopsis subvermispora (strain B) TaxID=914234 RepID=M2PTP5_CERS8|nr:hypothetical protein CERSUDRAFT_112303 [Gelatoporia subvermispora B]
MFFKNHSRDMRKWNQLTKRAEAKAQKEAAEDDGSDAEAPRRPGRPRKYKKSGSNAALPEWTKMPANEIHILSSDEDSIEILDQAESKNATKSVDTASPQKRARSRSRSITPPPALPAHVIQNARNTVQQILGITRRAPSPTYMGDESTDTIELDPELAAIAAQVQSQAQRGDPDAARLDHGGPERVKVKVRWKCHPLNPNGRSNVWEFDMRRHDTFHRIFDEVADIASIASSSLFVSFEGSHVYGSGTPHSLGAWADLELEACDRATHEHIQANKRQRSLSVQPVQNPANVSDHERSLSPTLEESDENSVVESASGTDTFRLTLRSAKTKDVTLTVRSTTTCAAIIKAFLKKTGLADQYPGISASPSKAKAKRGKAAAVAEPRLSLDGDKLNPASEIGDADLEDGDQVEVVGL